ncbi:MAG: ATP-binding protein, partial [Armatimonadetes bacterium]|nr:ATP-binding protein [Armatimonadota bacterium]
MAHRAAASVCVFPYAMAPGMQGTSAVCRSSAPGAVFSVLEGEISGIFSFQEGEYQSMIQAVPTYLRSALAEKIADSLRGPINQATPRVTYGPTSLPGRATAIVGARRAGKTTFVHQLRRERLVSGLGREQLPYVNFEDERLADLKAEHLGFLLEEYGRQAPGPTGPVMWCFDEIQTAPGWERFVRRLLDAGDVEVVVTGSSADLLSREIATALRGRAWQVPIYPFSFAEALQHAGVALGDNAHGISAHDRATLERSFMRWLTAGGFPELQGLDAATGAQLLRDYVDVAILRDVVERHRVGNVTALRWMVRQLLGNAASRFSIEKLHAILRSQGVAVARDTLHELLAHLEDCFLIRVVSIEASSERRRMVNPRKVYPVDAGLIPVFDVSGRSNIGHALETAVLVELERRRSTVTYVSTPEGYEVDFLVRGPAGEMD